MTRQRKTIAVEDVKQRVNHVLAAPTTSPEQRTGAYIVLEFILSDTGNYKGFQYLPSELKEDGTLKDVYDGTRRRYL